VIDGLNLVYHLYNNSPKKNCCYGGDYRTFHVFVCGFFRKLERCGIKPIVVMDGAADESKRLTQYRRCEEQAFRSVRCDPASQHQNVIKPKLATKVFIDAVKSFANAVVVKTLFEADAYLAMIGARLGCPVLSNDSDFFIFDVRFIPLRSIDLGCCCISDEHKVGGGGDGQAKDEDEEMDGLACEEFDRERFSQRFSVRSPPMLALLAVLMGNDYIEAKHFDRVFTQIRLPKKKHLSPRHKKMSGLLHWLSREDSVDSALDRLLDKDTKIRSRVISGIKMYALEEISSSKSPCDVEEVLAEVAAFDQSLGRKLSFEMADDLYEAYVDCRLPHAVEVLVNRGMMKTSQVESAEQPSSNEFVLPLTKEYFRHLFSRQKMLDDDEHSNVDVKVTMRKGKSATTVNLSLNGGGQSFDDMAAATTEEKRAHILNLLLGADGNCEDALSNVREEWKLLVACLCYWRRHTTSLQQQPTTAAVQVLALIVCILSDARTTDRDDNQLLDARMKKFRSADKSAKAARTFDRDLVHSFSNLQAVVYSAINLNNVLCRPFSEPDILFWNGTLLYNFVTEFSSSSADLALNYFDFQPDFRAEASKMLTQWCHILQIEKTEATHDNDDDDDDEDEDACDTLGYSDLNNRFAMLSF